MAQDFSRDRPFISWQKKQAQMRNKKRPFKRQGRK